MRRLGVVAGVILALGLSATAAQARLEGPFRDGFVRGAQDSCLKKQKDAAANSQISENLLAGYCGCSANFIADNSTADKMLLAAGDIQRGSPPTWLADLGKQATKFCIAHLRDYVPSSEQ
jgi:hypothetical protein